VNNPVQNPGLVARAIAAAKRRAAERSTYRRQTAITARLRVSEPSEPVAMHPDDAEALRELRAIGPGVLLACALWGMAALNGALWMPEILAALHALLRLWGFR